LAAERLPVGVTATGVEIFTLSARQASTVGGRVSAASLLQIVLKAAACLRHLAVPCMTIARE
jgi:hypothetical protein